MKRAVIAKHLVLWFCMLLMAGCVSGGRGMRIGRQFDTTIVNNIQKDQTTQGDIRAWFGEPYSKGFSDEVDEQGQPLVESWTYYYSVGRLDRTVAQMLVVAFDQGGKVVYSDYKEVIK